MKSKHSADSQSIPWLEPAMAEALELAREAAREDEVPVGAVVVKKETGKIVGRGHNRREKAQDPLAHAEIMAISDAARALKSWRLEGCALVITLEPCPMCLGACQQSRVEQVYYGTRDPKGGAISLGICFHEDARLHHRFQATLVATPECGALLTDFFAEKRGK